MDKTTTYYDWVSFFGELCDKIANFANDIENREKYLLEVSHKIFHSDLTILKNERIDPFSFIYALAQRNTKNQRVETFTNAKNAFGIEIDIPTDHIFPTPTPNTLSLFYTKGRYITKEGVEIGNESLWDLFVQVYKGAVNEIDFQKVLSLKNVGFTKLSQAMFLINPKKYIPFDTQMNTLPIPELTNLKEVVAKINAEGYSVYKTSLEQLNNAFPGCTFYEINFLNYLLNSNSENQIKISNKFCQISSWAYGQKDDDYFSDFVEQNAVWTGGASGGSGARTYPLTSYTRGDIVLVRRGTKNLGGVGIIIENQYLKDGFKGDATIKIIWLVKDDRKIDGTALGQWDGFSDASHNTVEKFREIYPETFAFIDTIRKIQKVMINHSEEKYKNLILQGPPGTGKTRLAKQIALWLTSDEEKSCSLIEAIDKRIFVGDPDIEDNPQIKLIQFHPSYTYEDFVRGIKVKTNGDKIEYIVENRILAAFAAEAAKAENTHKAYVLIIDEINRANLTSVLGELIYALEYRDKAINSMYKLNGGSREIVLPKNLYIIGTMNTADRSVSHLDYAIRRRFSFISVPSEELAITSNKAKILYNEVKKIFDEDTSPEFQQEFIQIGHSYFLVNDQEIAMKLKYDIKPLLYEYINDGVLLESARSKVDILHA